jgi:radical SAM protein with 4Fe4S-binding SPASM domain
MPLADRKHRSVAIYRRCAEPQIAWLVLGYACNRECQHCYARRASNLGFISAEVLRDTEALLSHLSLDRIVLIGGEPTLYPDLPRLISSMSQRASAVSLVSNGLRLASKDFARSLKRAGLSSVDISVGNDGARTPVPSHPGLKGLANALDLFGPDAASAVVTIDSFKDFEQLAMLVDRLERLELKRVAVNFALPNPAGLRANRHTAPPTIAAKVAVALYDYIIRHTALSPLFYLNLPLCLFPRSFVQSVFDAGHALTGCHAITGEGLVIDPAGNILPCTHWVDIANSTIEEALASIGTPAGFKGYWQHDKPMEWGRALFQPRHDACCACRLRANPCFGGCPLVWLQYEPQEHIPGWTP